MHSRFASNLVVLLVGCLLIAVRWMFGAGPARWLIFGGGCLVVGLVAVAFAVRGRGPVQRSIDAVLAVIGAWTVLSSLAFSPGTAGWLGFGEGGAYLLLGLWGLIAHEARMERALTAPLTVAPWPH